MNFGKKENFFERHRYLFQNYYFRFEGMDIQIVKEFENIVKNLSGVICKDADYIVTKKSYFYRLKNDDRKDYYSFEYILDSMRAKQALDITNYRLKKLDKLYQSRDACCLFSKYILRTESCKSYIDNNKCAVCIEDGIEEPVIHSEENNNKEYSESLKILKNYESGDQNNTSLRMQLEIERIPNINKKKLTVERQLISPKRRNKGVSHVNVLKPIEEPSQINNSCKMPVKSTRRSCTLNSKISDDHNLKSEQTNHVITRKRRKLLPINRLSIESLQDFENQSTEEVQDNNNSIEWWDSLPTGKKSYPKIKKLFVKSKSRCRSANFTKQEQQLMLSYLIINKKFAYATTRRTWREFHESGYMSHRLPEAVRNNYRKSVLPKIHTFGLPQDILKKFSVL